MIHLTEPEECISVIQIDDPKNRNPISENFIKDLSVKARLINQSQAKVLIIRGLKNIFCAGATLDFLQQMQSHYESDVEMEIFSYIKNIMASFSIPVIAAMEGSAVGGGLTMALFCDIVLAAEESRYGFSFMNMGFTPGMGTTQIAVETFGYNRAMEMMLTGDTKTGRELQRQQCSFNYILPKCDVFPKAMDIARAIAEKPKVSLKLLKKYLSIKRRSVLEESTTIEAFMHNISLNNEEVKNSIRENYTGA